MAAGEPRGRGYSGAHLLSIHTDTRTHTHTHAHIHTRAHTRGRLLSRYFGSRLQRVGRLDGKQRAGKQRAAPVLLLGACCAACLARAAGIIKIYDHTVIHLPRGGETVGIPLAHPSYWFHSSSQPATTQLLEQLCL